MSASLLTKAVFIVRFVVEGKTEIEVWLTYSSVDIGMSPSSFGR